MCGKAFVWGFGEILDREGEREGKREREREREREKDQNIYTARFSDL